MASFTVDILIEPPAGKGELRDICTGISPAILARTSQPLADAIDNAPSIQSANGIACRNVLIPAGTMTAYAIQYIVNAMFRHDKVAQLSNKIPLCISPPDTLTKQLEVFQGCREWCIFPDQAELYYSIFRLVTTEITSGQDMLMVSRVFGGEVLDAVYFCMLETMALRFVEGQITRSQKSALMAEIAVDEVLGQQLNYTIRVVQERTGLRLRAPQREEFGKGSNIAKAGLSSEHNGVPPHVSPLHPSYGFNTAIHASTTHVRAQQHPDLVYPTQRTYNHGQAPFGFNNTFNAVEQPTATPFDQYHLMDAQRPSNLKADALNSTGANNRNGMESSFSGSRFPAVSLRNYYNAPGQADGIQRPFASDVNRHQSATHTTYGPAMPMSTQRTRNSLPHPNPSKMSQWSI